MLMANMCGPRPSRDQMLYLSSLALHAVIAWSEVSQESLGAERGAQVSRCSMVNSGCCAILLRFGSCGNVLVETMRACTCRPRWRRYLVKKSGPLV